MAQISKETLRNAFYIVGGALVAIGGLDASLTLAGFQPLHLIPDNIAHIMAVAGAAIAGYAKTGKIFGDASAQDLVASNLQAKLEQPVSK